MGGKEEIKENVQAFGFENEKEVIIWGRTGLRVGSIEALLWHIHVEMPADKWDSAPECQEI